MVFCVREERAAAARESEEEEEELASMAMSSHERSSSSLSKPLHNFTLPFLKWGHQRHLRCMKLDGSLTATTTTTTTTSFNEQRPRRRSPLSSKLRKDSEEEGIDAVREKIINDLKTAADKMKDKILREEVELKDEDEDEESSPAAAAIVVAAAPWNLRTRRAACKAPPVGGAAGGRGFRIEEKKSNSSSIKSEAVGAKSPRLKEAKKERAKFAVNLTKKEIEEDFMELVGHRPPRRPKKRPRYVQKQLDTLFPGLWLTEVTVDLYKVPELADNGKR